MNNWAFFFTVLGVLSATAQFMKILAFLEGKQ